MTPYRPDTDPLRVLLFDVLQAPAALASLSAFAEVDSDLMAQVID